MVFPCEYVHRDCKQEPDNPDRHDERAGADGQCEFDNVPCQNNWQSKDNQASVITASVVSHSAYLFLRLFSNAMIRAYTRPPKKPPMSVTNIASILFIIIRSPCYCQKSEKITRFGLPFFLSSLQIWEEGVTPEKKKGS